MSCMRCDSCGVIVDTDFDADSLYVSGAECLCKWCRYEENRPSEFERPEPPHGE